MAPKSFPTTDMRTVPPIEFDLGGETFRVPRKQRHDIMVMVSGNLVELADGQKAVKADACRQAILLFLARELWNPEGTGAPLEEQPDAPAVEIASEAEGEVLDIASGQAVWHEGMWHHRGAWETVDDPDRYIRLTRGARVEVADQTYGDVLDYITTEVTGHPTGVPS